MIGTTVSHYRIVERIGGGAMGDVYRARDLSLPRMVALKFVTDRHANDPQFARRFMVEAQAASALDHPNVCTIYEVGTAPDGRMFIVMAYYEGVTLRARLRQGPLAVADVLHYAAAIADGMTAAHEKGILHRDIKPGNVMITSANRIKILDFGLARLAGSSRVTRSGAALGTLGYMSPEMVRGRAIDHRSDIFSLGVTLYEMATGQRPFEADNEAGIIHRILNHDPPPASRLRPDLSPEVDRIVQRALERKRERRYPAMRDLRDDLRRELARHAPGPEVGISSTSTTLPVLRRAPATPVARGLLVLGLAASAVFLSGDSRRFDARDPAPGGVAVLPLRAPGSGPRTRALAAGLTREITDRIALLGAGKPGLWVLPAGRVEESGAPAEAAQTRSLFGVGTVVTGIVRRAGPGYEASLRLVLLEGTRTAAGRELAIAGREAAPSNLEAGLAALLDLPAPGAEPQPRSGPAFEEYLVGRGYLAAGEPESADSALAAFDRALARDSTFAAARVRRAEALLEKGRRTGDSGLAGAALEACRDALRFGDAGGALHAVSGHAHARLGDRERAVEAYRRALEANPLDHATRNRLALTLLGLGRSDLALLEYRKSVEIAPGFFAGYEGLGYVYYARGEYEQAIEQFEKVAALAPGHAPTYNYLGAIYYFLERWDEAIAQFELSFSLGRTYEACANLGTLYYMEERFDDAVRMYEWALDYDSLNHVLVGNLAGAYLWMAGERERADSLFARAIELAEAAHRAAPNDFVLASYLAGYHSVNDPATARAYAEAARSGAPDNAEVLFRAAAAYEQLGDRVAALTLLKEAVRLGFSFKVVSRERVLRDLRDDPRYANIRPPVTEPDP